CQQETNWSLSF
nr:immunoglobulin light chain junction region [Macaca mulatta]MOV36967.1 immunoglobulin light chain junction region [Macaca mulatta]MOV37009.1 immunoglobulin light chain junction region [Macaca mulatta]MOV37201.1 immunoglobulin light chain junction region [Macaca mulatta]MOV37385.1 immunoglobulin light chain junction region [Macaca mulatta]